MPHSFFRPTYEQPERPDIHLRTEEGAAEEMAERVVRAVALRQGSA